MTTYFEQHTLRSFNPGQIVFREGDMGFSMFVVKSGKVEVSTQVNNQKRVLAELTEGAIFGEMALFDSQVRSATVTAITPLTCIEINNVLFKQHLAKIPPYMRSLYQILAERLRETNKKQSAGDPKDSAKRVVCMLNQLLSMIKPDNFDYVSLPWQSTVESISFIMNQPPELVDRVMMILSLSPLAGTKQDYEFGRLFQTNDYKSFQKFSDYCRQHYLKRMGIEIDSDLTDLTESETAFINFIKRLLSEQANASDIPRELLEAKCTEYLSKPIEEFELVLKSLIRSGIITPKLDSYGDRFYEIDREMLEGRANKSNLLELFKSIVAKF